MTGTLAPRRRSHPGAVDLWPMDDDPIDDAAENIRILVREELETQHRLDGHPEPVPECPVCESHRVPPAPPGPRSR